MDKSMFPPARETKIIPVSRAVENLEVSSSDFGSLEQSSNFDQ